MAARALALQREGADGASFGWLDSHGITGRDFLASYARVFDTTVIARPESVSDGPRMGALEAALFESGRPVLLAPPGGATKIGENILIAWNGTPEAARTVAFAKPLLRRARHVPVVDRKSVGEGKSVSVPVDFGGRLTIKKKKKKHQETKTT